MTTTLLERILTRLSELEDEDRARRASSPPPPVDAPAAAHFGAARQSARRARQLLAELGAETRGLSTVVSQAFQRREESCEQILKRIYKLLDARDTCSLTEAERAELDGLTKRSREQILNRIYKLQEAQSVRPLTEPEQVELARLTERYEAGK